MAVFSISEIRKFKRCRQQWDFSAPTRRGLEPKRPKAYYMFGSLFHDALEQYYVAGVSEPWVYFAQESQGILSEWRDTPLYDTLAEEQQMGIYILQAFAKRWAPRHDDFEVIGAEVRDLIELPNGHHFTFQYDGLVERPSGLWLLEHKTTRGSITGDYAWLQIDDQAAAYQWAVERALGIRVTGTIYTYYRKKPPTVPKELKGGGLSKAKNIVTTVECYYDEVLRQGLNPRHYQDMLQYVASREGDDYFRRVELLTSEEQRRLIGEQIVALTTEMGRPDVLVYAAPNQMCETYCPFFEPCVAMHTGRNYERMLQEDYEVGGYY